MANTHKNLKEEAFEVHIKDELVKKHAYRERQAETSYNRSNALDSELFFEFLKASQPKEMGRLEEMYGPALQDRLLRRIDEEISARGIIDVLHKGIEEGPVRLQIVFFRPVTSLNPEIEELYEKNIWSVMRQVKFSEETEQALDLAIFLNGLPIATAELKNEITGQNVYHAMRQYRTDRSPDEKLFSFRRCAAHFAVDTSQVFLTTHLKEDRTFFLPFNKGYEDGAGNPPVEGKHKSYYLWEEVWSPDNWSDLLQFFVHAFDEVKEDRSGKQYKVPVQVFPRYHQWRTVSDLLASSRKNGSGKNYLIQHSAGSGKSMTIAWLAYRLAELGCRELDLPYRSIFDMYSRHDMERPFNVTMGGVVAKPDLICEVGGSTLYVEFDRDTETKKEITNKYRRYRKIWETLSDKGVTNLPKLIFVFTLYDRMLNSMDDFAEVARKDTGKYAGKIGPVYFRYMPELQFKYNRNMPSDGRFVTGEFERIGNKPIYLFNKKAANSVAA